jgi:hypothetical protein
MLSLEKDIPLPLGWFPFIQVNESEILFNRVLHSNA